MLHLHTDSVLEVTVHSAHGLEKVERLGQNDPYVRLSVDVDNDKQYKKFKTETKSNSADPSWEQSFDIREVEDKHTDLYVEVLDEDKGADAPIAYTAIPLNQVKEAHNHSLSARFDLYNKHGVAQGEISLTLRIVQPGQESSGRITYDGNFQKAVSRVDEEQKKRFKKLILKETASDVGAASVLGGFAAIGAGLLAGQHKKAEEAKKRDEALAENQ
ncbi:Extended synaptotagmin-1 [Linnemannia elongata]|nr:Extended synaptotagmin-1 [Linnemannia elongata]